MLGVVVGGAMLGSSYPPFTVPYLSLVAFGPVFWAWWQAPSARAALRYGVVFHGASFAIAFSWPLLHAMPGVALASLAPLLVLVFVLAIPFSASWPVLRRRGLVAGLSAFASVHLIAEAALSYGPFAMPWPLLGNALADAAPVRMLASLSGVAGLSAWVLGVNVLLFLAAAERGRARLFALGLAGVVLVCGWAGSRLLEPDHRAIGEIEVALVQPSLPVAAWADLNDRSRVHRLVTMTESLYAASEQLPVLTVWPETALPPCAGELPCRDLGSTLDPVTARGAPPLLTGAIVAESSAAGGTNWFNAALLLDSARGPERYDKNRLVPFAEAVPFAEYVPAFASLGIDAGGISGYVPGRMHRLFEVAGVRLGALVCFESLFSQDVRAYVSAGADVIVVVSQDGWWGRSFGHAQHLAFTRLRAVESGRPIIFAAATGISAVIAANGVLTASIPFGERAALIAPVPLSQRMTTFARFGDWVTVLAVLAGVVVLTRELIWRFRSRTR